MNKIAFSGTHGTGKTASVYQKAHELQRKGSEVFVLSELALSCPFDIEHESTHASQLWIFSEQMARETSVGPRYDYLVADRTVMDAVAYSYVLGFTALAHLCFPLAACQMGTYDTVYFKSLEKNSYEGTSEFRERIDRTLLSMLYQAQSLGAEFELRII